jgi:hypothetical protein
VDLTQPVHKIKFQGNIYPPRLTPQIARRFLAYLDQMSSTADMVFHAPGTQVFFDIRFGHANVEVPLKGDDSRTIHCLSAALDNSVIGEPSRCNSYRKNAERNDFPHRKTFYRWHPISVGVVTSPLHSLTGRPVLTERYGLIRQLSLEGEVLDEARQWLGIYNPKR